MGNTKTSNFGISGRYNHDSSEFYGKKIYNFKNNDSKFFNINLPQSNIKYLQNPLNEKNINKIFCKTSEDMNELPDSSVHLMVTSPPYNVGKEYDDDLSLNEYLELLENVFRETYRVLVPGGRVAINIANIGRKPYIPLNAYINKIMHDLGFIMRGEIIWDKSASAGGSCAWGSWQSATNPVLRDIHEYILIFSKDTLKRIKNERESTITKEEFLEYTKSIWKFNTESAKKVNHPAPFPVELPRRVIQLYTFKGDVILDPFMGVGTTAVAALKSCRYYVGYEISNEYYQNALSRINKEKVEQQNLDTYE